MTRTIMLLLLMMKMMSLPPSSHHSYVLMNISGIADGGIDWIKDAAASLMLRVDSWMTWRQWWSWECVWLQVAEWLTCCRCTREGKGKEEEEEQQRRSREMSDIKADRRLQTNNQKKNDRGSRNGSVKNLYMEATSASCTQASHNHQHVLLQDLQVLHLKWNCNS